MSANVSEFTEINQFRGIHFNWVEYTIFFIMLGASALIGVYFGFINSAKNTVQEYMLGGKNMPIFPVAISLVASFLSGITLLGTPSETYLYGTQLYVLCPAILIAAVLFNMFYLPILFNLGSPSIFEYLERRFNTTTRSIGSLMYTFSLALYIPVVIYVPSLAFNQVTGMPMEVIALIVCCICIFYTTLGGLKGVVWSDAFQSFFTVSSLITIVYLGLESVGGFGAVLGSSKSGERLEFFNFDPDPFKRNTFWTVLIGSVVTWTSFLALHPAAYQRYISLATYRVSYSLAIGLGLVKAVCTLTGLIIYTKYHDCDPVITKDVEKPGQILPYFVVDVAGQYPGLTGLFLSGVVSTALSTMSTGLNTIAGTFFEDYIKPIIRWKPNDRQSNCIIKGLVVILGFISTALVFVVAKMGTIMQTAITLNGVTTGVTFFIFSFGMFIPWANSKGAIAGSICGLIVVTWVAMGTQMAVARGDISFPPKITTIDNCVGNISLRNDLNSTTFGNAGYGTLVIFADSVPWLYRISYLYYAPLGVIIGMIVGTFVSLITGTQDLTKLDPELIIPQLRWTLSNSKNKSPSPPLELYKPITTQEDRSYVPNKDKLTDKDIEQM